MKKLILFLIGCSLLSVPAALAQATAGGLQTFQINTGTTPTEKQDIKFDLDFPGGTPEKLVKAIEKSAGKPLNAIIPSEFANEQLPALRMKSVTVKDLFKALQQSTTKTVRYQTGGGSTQQATASSGFQTQGTPDYESIWYFYKTAPNEQAESKVCRFYNLASYLETYKVEDITTAVQTGWKMLGETWPPVLNYHQDTRLLIVVGEPAKLSLIDTVLSELGKYQVGKTPKPAFSPPVANPAEPAKK